MQRPCEAEGHWFPYRLELYAPRIENGHIVIESRGEACSLANSNVLVEPWKLQDFGDREITRMVSAESNAKAMIKAVKEHRGEL